MRFWQVPLSPKAVAQVFFALSLAVTVASCGSSKSTEELITSVKQQDSGAYSAAIALGSRQDPQAIDPLLSLLAAQDTHLKEGALMGLGHFDDVRTIKAIVLHLGHADEGVRKEANYAIESVLRQKFSQLDPALAELHNENPKALEPLVSLLTENLNDSGTADGKAEAITLLGKTKVDSVIDTVQPFLKDEEDKLRIAATEAVGTVGNDRAVDMLIKLVDAETDPGWKVITAEALGTTNQPKAIDYLLKALQSKDAVTAEAATLGLGKTKDKRAVDALLAALKSPDTGYNEQFRESLVKIGKPAVDPLIASLQHEDAWVRQQVAIALGDIGDTKAVDPLKGNLTDWHSSQSVAEALMKLNWQPSSDQDSIHLWVAQRNAQQLTDQWDKTQTVLLADVSSGNTRAISNALFAFIGLGNAEIIPTLITTLENDGDKEMALAYLNCGHDELETAAEDWAAAHGYTVYETTDAPDTVSWGSF